MATWSRTPRLLPTAPPALPASISSRSVSSLELRVLAQHTPPSVWLVPTHHLDPSSSPRATPAAPPCLPSVPGAAPAQQASQSVPRPFKVAPLGQSSTGPLRAGPGSRGACSASVPDRAGARMSQVLGLYVHVIFGFSVLQTDVKVCPDSCGNQLSLHLPYQVFDRHLSPLTFAQQTRLVSE